MLNSDSHNVRQSIRPGGPLYLRLLQKIPLAQVRSGTRGRPPPKGWVFTRWGSSGASTSHSWSDT